ncbi:MAG: 3'-5' exonuclease, partial [Verrucomicrobiota bacterium]
NTPPFKVCHQDVLLELAFAGEEGAPIEVILGRVNLGKRHDRLAPSLAAAVQEALGRDPQSLPRRPRTVRHSLTTAETAHQDRLKAVRDRLAAQHGLESTLIATRAQLVELACDISKIDEVLLPWQAGILRRDPAFQPVENKS